jgi:hypothetical protein
VRRGENKIMREGVGSELERRFERGVAVSLSGRYRAVGPLVNGFLIIQIRFFVSQDVFAHKKNKK